MKNEKYAVCNECSSKFLKSTSVMESLCPECASIIYGYPNCNHIFKMADAYIAIGTETEVIT